MAKKKKFDPRDKMTVDDRGVIRQPGKFEGEMWWIPELWDLVLDSSSDGSMYDGDTPIDFFNVDAKMRRKYGIIPGVDYVILWESDQGFVNSKQLTAREFRDLQATLEEGHDED